MKQVMISIDGKIVHLNKSQRCALRQACAIEQHACLKRRDNTRSKHLQEEYMEQALFLERLYKDLYVPLPPMKSN